MMLALLLAAGVAARPAPAGGKLVVLVVIDQLRYQDLLWLSDEIGPRGFAGLGTPAPLRYETVVTETAADHAVLSTGAYAELNGIIGNRYWEGGRSREAVEDPACPSWGASKAGRSAAALLAPTVGDAFKLNTNGAGRVVSVAVKDRSALFLAGTSADLVLWWDEKSGEVTSTTCYAPAPPPWLPRHQAEEWKDWVWTPSRPAAVARLAPQESVPGAMPLYDIGRGFPHKVGNGAVDARLFGALRRLPPGTTVALRTARAAVKDFGLGERGGTDLLELALSAVDGVGHQFGTMSRERVDAVLRTHDELGAFLDELRARLGPRLSVVLTSDHGLTPMAADLRRLRVTQGGSLDIEDLTLRLERALSEQLGPRSVSWVANIDAAALWLRPPFPDRAVALAVDFLRQEPAFWKVVPFDEIDGAEPAVRHAWFPGRSGQALLVLRPLWMLKKANDGADHGSPWNDDALVPFLVRARGFRVRGSETLRATQVAPAVAVLLGTAPPAAALDLPAIEHE
jgi:hypothetical protein